MRRTVPLLFLFNALLAVPTALVAQHTGADKIASALNSAPASVSAQATVMDWDQTVLREGTNGWTCLPDMPDTPGDDPMCLDAPWMNWADAWMNKKEPSYSQMGFGYMLTGDSPASNTDPYAAGPTPDNEWLPEGVPHLMILVPDTKALEGLPTDPKQGGPWVMWRGTPYVHIMVPMPKHESH
ncbi:MAG: hypothetical protein AMS20_17990 [Gemmatimonas sp. SG8_28]|nr:MAG: hypothetical protein AMS20_17990 [Gemmatimonas sp. SG8_28]